MPAVPSWLRNWMGKRPGEGAASPSPRSAAVGKWGEEQAAAFLTELGVRPKGPILQYRRKHVFTHVEWRMCVYAADAAGDVPEGMKAASPEDALPTAWRICLTKP